MPTFQLMPPELFYQIALHLPLTRDVLAFSLTNTLIRDALSTPALFKARLALRGWDVSAWNDEDDVAQSPGNFRHWTRIDHNFCRTAQLFDEASVKGYFHETIVPDSPIHEGVVASGPAHPDPGPGQDDQIPDPRPVLDEEKTVAWLRKLSRVLPLFVTHNRGGNISRITEAKHIDALRAYAALVEELCTGVTTLSDDGEISQSAPTITSSEYGWLERICFSLIALLLQCDAITIVSIFEDRICAETIYSQESTSSAFENSRFMQPPTVPKTLTPKRISRRYFAVFFSQTILLAALHRDAVLPSWQPPSLAAPSLPPFDPRSSSFYYSHPYHDNGPSVEPGAFNTAWFDPLRPWLHDGLAGTPLAALSSTTSCAWAGYFTYRGNGERYAMYIELRSAPAGVDTKSAHDCVYFHGEGRDDEEGAFNIIGTCDTRTGVITAAKTYELMGPWDPWDWHGMLTPFGMAEMWGSWGAWGGGWGNGWWWIWPREWSPATIGQHD